MTVASATARSGPYAGNGSTTVFAYTFRILNEAHLKVTLTSAAGVETVQTLTTHYSVSGVGASGGGSVTMVTPPASGETLTVLRNVPFTQETDYTNQGAYYAETVEDALDLLTMAAQQLKEKVSRAVTVPVNSTIDPALPAPVANALIGWNATADALANLVPNTGDYVDAGLATLTAAEAAQLNNIDGTTISAAQWGYLGAASAVGGALMAAATGATARTALGLQIATPEDYGAVGDGSTDDTTALQALMDACDDNAATCWFPSGKTYIIDGKLTIGSGTEVRGYGATIKAADNCALDTGVYITNSAVSARRTDVAIYGLTIDGNSSGGRTLPGSGANLYSQCDGLTLQDVTCQNGAVDGIYLGGAEIGPITRDNTAQAGSASTITLDAGASGTDDTYNGEDIFLWDGTGQFQRRTISDYVGSTKVATVSVAWDTQPDSTTKFAIGTGVMGLSRRNTLINCKCNNNYRNGLSIVGVNGFQIIGGQFNNNSGTNPQTGIDIEPNNAGTINANGLIEGVEASSNSGSGILEQVSGKNFNIRLYNLATDYNTGNGYSQSGIIQEVSARNIRGTGNSALIPDGSRTIDLDNPWVGTSQKARANLSTVQSKFSLRQQLSGSITTTGSYQDVANSAFTVPAHYATGRIVGWVSFKFTTTNANDVEFRLYNTTGGAALLEAETYVHEGAIGDFQAFIPVRSNLSGAQTALKLQANLAAANTVGFTGIYMHANFDVIHEPGV